MKLSILLVLFTACQVHAGVFAQTVTVNVKQTEIKKILNSIEKKGDVRFLYNYELPELKTKVDFSAQNLPVRSALDKLFGNTDLAYKVLDNNLIVINSKKIAETSPDITVTGKVTGDNGEPLSGVSILIKGTTRGTTTDNNGIYSLSVDKGAVLVVSYVGYTTKEVPVNGQETINVQLKSSTSVLDQVVVVGYGTQRKSNITGAIASVKGSDLENMATVTASQSMEGRISGVTIAQNTGQPGGAATITIRGVTTINNSNPLFIVDGVPVDNITYLNQSDIASIEVLKDAASAAIYGTRAANGVILITTKKGRAGAVQVSYNGYYGVQQPWHKLKVTNATQYATLRNESSVAAGNGTLFPNPQSLGAGTNWQDVIFNNSANQTDHELSLSGGNEKASFYSSFGYLDQAGIVASPISNYKRLTARFNGSYKPASWLTFGNNFSYEYEKQLGGVIANTSFGGPLASAVNLDPLTPVLQTDPTIIAQYNTISPYIVLNPQGIPYGLSQIVGQEISNPLAYDVVNAGNYTYAHNIIGDVYGEVEIIKGLRFRTDIGTKLSFYGNETFTPLYYLSPTRSNGSTNSFYRENDQSLRWDWSNILSYQRRIGLHNFTVLVGTEAQKYTGSGVNGTYYGLPVNTFAQASMNFAIAATNTASGGFESAPYALQSYFGRILYDYDGRYLFTGILRRDGSTRFGSNNRYAYFPSASVGWVPSKESFWKQNKVVNFLKIRAGYGVNGNDQSAGDFAYMSTIAGGSNYPVGSSLSIGYSPSRFPNPDLKWEKTSQLDLGFDATLFNNFTLTFDWFNKKTTGMILQMQLPGYSGYAGLSGANPYANIASLYNRGVELALGYNKQLGEVKFSANANVTYIKNMVTDIGVNAYIPGGTFQGSSYEVTRIMVGMPINGFYGFKTEGLFQTPQDVANYVSAATNKPIQPNAQPGDFKFADLNGDGQITSADREYLGSSIPKWTFGATVTAAWKNFDVVVFGQGVAGNKIFDGIRRLDIPQANYTTDFLNRWTGPGTSNNFPRLDDNDPNGNFTSPSEFYLKSGAYFRIKTFQIGYSIPASVIGKVGISKLRVYVSSNNLFTITKYTGFDPEIGGNIGNGQNGQNNGNFGIDNGIYPQARSFLVGLNLIF